MAASAFVTRGRPPFSAKPWRPRSRPGPARRQPESFLPCPSPAGT